jgi:hypothetical protein
VPSRNIEELVIVVWEQQDREISQENVDINNNVSGHENPPMNSMWPEGEEHG